MLALLLAAALFAATRPHYGGVLRVQLQDAIQGADPPQLGPGIPDLFAAFTITRWESGSRAAFSANPSAAGGRPFLDSIEIEMGRPTREMTIALDTGKADIIQLDPAAMRRPPAGVKIWSSSPVRLVALRFFGSEDARLREAVSLAVDRTAIQRVLLQGQGEVSGALLPQWLSGYAFLFPAAADVSKSRALAAALPAASRSLTLSFDSPALRPIADRIVLNARDAGIAFTIAPSGGTVRLVQTRMISSDPAKALAGVAISLGLPEPPRALTPEALYNAERNLLDGFRVIPLFHLPDVYAVSPRVKGGPGISPLGEWRFENLWLENPRP
jgi:ABC-type transport system substrate-binding protein